MSTIVIRTGIDLKEDAIASIFDGYRIQNTVKGKWGEERWYNIENRKLINDVFEQEEIYMILRPKTIKFKLYDLWRIVK